MKTMRSNNMDTDSLHKFIAWRRRYIYKYIKVKVMSSSRGADGKVVTMLDKYQPELNGKGVSSCA
jgi:hypothetical protein